MQCVLLFQSTVEVLNVCKNGQCVLLFQSTIEVLNICNVCCCFSLQLRC